MGFLNKDIKNGDYVSVISEECYFQGTLDLQGSVRVDGAESVEILSTAKLNGNVRSKKILIEGGAEVNASIKVVNKEEPENFEDEEKIDYEEEEKKETSKDKEKKK